MKSPPSVGFATINGRLMPSLIVSASANVLWFIRYEAPAWYCIGTCTALVLHGEKVLPTELAGRCVNARVADRQASPRHEKSEGLGLPVTHNDRVADSGAEGAGPCRSPSVRHPRSHPRRDRGSRK